MVKKVNIYSNLKVKLKGARNGQRGKSMEQMAKGLLRKG